jgi:lysozyme
MDVNKLKKELALDEGVKHEIYLDHLGYPTFGIGHLIKKDDPEYGSPVKTPVSEERVDECFKEDIKVTLADCLTLYDDFYELPEEAQLIIANMMFNMGLPRMKKFRGMKRGVDARDWNKAADEMVDSAWYSQVGKRSERLVNRMRALADGE